MEVPKFLVRPATLRQGRTNAEYASGIASSLPIGVKAASGTCSDNIMIEVADMLRLSITHFEL